MLLTDVEDVENVEPQAFAALLEQWRVSLGGVSWVAWNQQAIVGHATLRRCVGRWVEHRGELSLGVRQEHQRQGIAKALLSKVISSCALLGISQIEARVREYNFACQAFLEKHGFERKAVLPNAASIQGSQFSDYWYIQTVLIRYNHRLFFGPIAQ